MRKHCVTWLWLLSIAWTLLGISSAEQQADEHRIQRRFMWQPMDNSVMSGIMGRMFKGARAMKSMFGDLLPQLPSNTGFKSSGSMLDLTHPPLPTATTRVTYIIRNPHTKKPMKIIKMRGPPKKLKLIMSTLPNQAHSTESAGKSSYEGRMRQLEKEQELIAEGKLPMTSDEAIMDKYFKQKGRGSNEIVSGKIMEYQSWKPVYRPGEQPSSFVTLRPQPLSQLHTDIAPKHEHLPRPEKLIGQGQDEDEVENELAKQMNHKYEVTEHTGEESGEVHVHVQMAESMESGFVPSKGHHQSQSSNQEQNKGHQQGLGSTQEQNQGRYRDLDSNQEQNQGHQQGLGSTQEQNQGRYRDLDSNQDQNEAHYQDQSQGQNKGHHQGLGQYRSPAEQQRPRHRSRTNNTSSSSTEAPNYPAQFLKKYREREREQQQAKQSKRHKGHKEVVIINDEPSSRENMENSWTPSTNISYSLSSLRARLQEQQRREKHKQRQEEERQEQRHEEQQEERHEQRQEQRHGPRHEQRNQHQVEEEQQDEQMEAALVEAMHGEKWPAEVQHSYVTIGPSAVAFMQPEPDYKLPKSQKRHRSNLRQRGSVRFGDKPNYDEM